MRPQPYIFLLFILGFLSCSQKKDAKGNSKIRIRISFEIIPEDHEKNLYYVEWKDTLGIAEGYQGSRFIKRPKEIWCVVTNNHNDTLGYYKGLSTAQTFAGFESKDSIVYLNFMIGLNIFPDQFDDTQNTLEHEKAARDYFTKFPIPFEAIQINLKTDLRKKYDVELREK